MYRNAKAPSGNGGRARAGRRRARVVDAEFKDVDDRKS
jgi:hypothetical protein